MAKRSKKGQLIAELPVILFTAIFGLLFPLLDLSVIGMRAGFVFAGSKFACHKAATGAAFERSFENNPSMSALGMQSFANFMGRVDGVTITETKVQILRVPTGQNMLMQMYNSKLPQPADTVNNRYYIRVSAKASIKPILVLPFCQNVPGLGADIPLHVAADQYCENPRGLHI